MKSQFVELYSTPTSPYPWNELKVYFSDGHIEVFYFKIIGTPEKLLEMMMELSNNFCLGKNIEYFEILKRSSNQLSGDFEVLYQEIFNK